MKNGTTGYIRTQEDPVWDPFDPTVSCLQSEQLWQVLTEGSCFLAKLLAIVSRLNWLETPVSSTSGLPEAPTEADSRDSESTLSVTVSETSEGGSWVQSHDLSDCPDHVRIPLCHQKSSHSLLGTSWGIIWGT